MTQIIITTKESIGISEGICKNIIALKDENDISYWKHFVPSGQNSNDILIISTSEMIVSIPKYNLLSIVFKEYE